MVTQRITSTAGGALMLANLQATFKQLTKLQDQISSGKVISTPSDDPAGVISALDYRSLLRRNEQYERNAGDAQNWLNTADSALVTAQQYMNRSRDLLLQGVNGATDGPGREAIADELDELIGGMLQLARTQYQNRPIFNGFSNNVQVYDGQFRFLGDPTEAATGEQVMRPVAPGVDIRVNTTGPEVFGQYSATDPYAGNVFQVLRQAAADLRAGNVPGGSRAIGEIDRLSQGMSGVQAELGARSRRLEDVISRAQDVTLELKSSLSAVEDIDLPQTLIYMKQQEMAYQAALSATAKVIQPSLVDFLR